MTRPTSLVCENYLDMRPFAVLIMDHDVDVAMSLNTVKEKEIPAVL